MRHEREVEKPPRTRHAYRASWLDRLCVAGGCVMAVIYPLVLIASCAVEAVRR
ncbi:hypothetical protein GCM10010417_26740 [Streptomyces carpaticus]